MEREVFGLEVLFPWEWDYFERLDMYFCIASKTFSFVAFGFGMRGTSYRKLYEGYIRFRARICTDLSCPKRIHYRRTRVGPPV